MEPAVMVLVCLVVVSLVGMAGLALLVVRERRRTADLDARLAESTRRADRAESDLAERVDRLEQEWNRPGADGGEYVITRVGDPGGAEAGSAAPGAVPVSNQVVLSAALGEPMVRALALGHGLRRALSARSRNEISFQARQETKRSRRQHRADVKEAARQIRLQRRGAS